MKVRFCGFESTTTALQTQGWQISVELIQMFERASIQQRVAFKHDGLKQMALGIMEYDQHQVMQTKSFEPFDFGIDINIMAPMIQVQVVPQRVFSGATFGQWAAIDASPQMSQIKSLDEIAIFKTVKSEDFEIVLRRQDEEKILKVLLEMQDEKQKEIRQNMKRRTYQMSQGGIYEPEGFKDVINSDISHQLVLVS